MSLEEDQQKRKMYREAVVEYCATLPGGRESQGIKSAMEEYDIAVHVNSPENPITQILAKKLNVDSSKH